jgi:FkbM family methyltransferase
MNWRGVLKPEYLYRPSQIIRRVRLRLEGMPEFVDARLPWGAPIRVRPTETIGRSVLQLGLFDLAVTETLFRLVGAGDTVADVGANIGYMTNVLAHRAGPSGSVHCFEPHPALFAELTHNLDLWRRTTPCDYQPKQAAVSDRAAELTLSMPETFSSNRGIATLEPEEGKRYTTVTVPGVTMDEVFSDRPPVLVKMDVEGHEHHVLNGATTLIEGRRVRDWVFEENSGYPSPVTRFFDAQGYTVLRIVKHFTHAELLPADQAVEESGWESPNYLATLDPGRAKERFAAKGWTCLR